MISLLQSLSFLFILFGLSFGNIFKSFSYGNEYDQLLKYCELVKIKNSKQTKQFNETLLFEKNRDCEKSIIPEKGFRFYNCRHTIRDSLILEENVVELFKHKLIKNKNGYQHERRCQYQIDYNHTKRKNHSSKIKNKNIMYFGFTIIQEKCESEVNNIYGGSTFEINVQSNHCLYVCHSIDNFDNTYSVECICPLKIGEQNYKDSNSVTLESSSLKVCLKISVVLHFETFDAFYDVGVSDWSSLNYHLENNKILCFPNNYHSISNKDYSSRVSTLSAALSHSHSKNLDSKFWLRQMSDENQFENENINPKPTEYFYHSINEKDEEYIKRSSFLNCLSDDSIIHFIGESHMRYQFDVTMDRFIDKLRVGRYHGSMNISGISYSDMTFSARLSQFIDSIQCSDKFVAYVMQTGSWDLQFFGPRGFVMSPYQGQSIIKSLIQLKKRMQSHHMCEQNIGIVWMTTMPHPWCNIGDAHCIRLMNYWRNNGAIQAINQFMEIQLTSIGIKKLVILDSHQVIVPRFPFNEFVCVDHFMCNDPPRGLISTPPGVAMAMSVLEASCTLKSQLTSKDYFYGGIRNKYLHNSTEFGGNGNKYILIDGCKRLVPDTATLNFLKVNEKLFVGLNSIDINDIPDCHRATIPSRKTKTLIQLYSSKTVYILDAGQKRAVMSASVLEQLNLSFDDVQFVLEEDFNEIPTGKDLYDKKDCFEC